MTIPDINNDALMTAVGLALDGDWHAAHEIAQIYSNTTANWLHAVLHKIEGDAWNSRYWYARTVGRTYEDFANARDELLQIRQSLIAQSR